MDYVREHDIIVVRRLSGGGLFITTLGTSTFHSLRQVSGNFHNFQKFTQPVIQVLTKMGVPAELSERNDILANGKKISGNAQYVSGHGWSARHALEHGPSVVGEA